MKLHVFGLSFRMLVIDFLVVFHFIDNGIMIYDPSLLLLDLEFEHHWGGKGGGGEVVPFTTR